MERDEGGEVVRVERCARRMLSTVAEVWCVKAHTLQVAVAGRAGQGGEWELATAVVRPGNGTGVGRCKFGRRLDRPRRHDEAVRAAQPQSVSAAMCCVRSVSRTPRPARTLQPHASLATRLQCRHCRERPSSGDVHHDIEQHICTTLSYTTCSFEHAGAGECCLAWHIALTERTFAHALALRQSGQPRVACWLHRSCPHILAREPSCARTGGGGQVYERHCKGRHLEAVAAQLLPPRRPLTALLVDRPPLAA